MGAVDSSYSKPTGLRQAQAERGGGYTAEGAESAEESEESPLTPALSHNGLTGVGIYPHPNPLPRTGEGVCWSFPAEAVEPHAVAIVLNGAADVGDCVGRQVVDIEPTQVVAFVRLHVDDLAGIPGSVKKE